LGATNVHRKDPSGSPENGDRKKKLLEAMALGMCVAAENQPTASEFILRSKKRIL
jgi:hypothetical protein